MNNAEKNVVKYYSDQILEYRVQINQPKDFCQFANLIKLNSESVDKLKKDFPCASWYVSIDTDDGLWETDLFDHMDYSCIEP